MKCIRKNGSDKESSQDQVRRVSNDEAAKLVKDGWHYVPKSAWKHVGRPKE